MTNRWNCLHCPNVVMWIGQKVVCRLTNRQRDPFSPCFQNESRSTATDTVQARLTAFVVGGCSACHYYEERGRFTRCNFKRCAMPPGGYYNRVPSHAERFNHGMRVCDFRLRAAD